MSKIIRYIFVGLLCTLLLITAACQIKVGREVQEQETNEESIFQSAGFTFIPQEIQPIEENPFMLPLELSSQSGLDIFSVEGPQIDETMNCDEIVNAVLGTADQIVILKNQEIKDSLSIQTDENSVKNMLSDSNEYINILFQQKNIEQDNSNQDNAHGLSGSINFDKLSQYVFNAGGMQDSSNSAVLLKYRSSGAIGVPISFSNSNIVSVLEIERSGQLNFWTNDDQNQDHYERRNVGTLKIIDTEWYYALAAMDENFGYKFIVWQESNPANNAYYSSNLGKHANFDDERYGQHIFANIGLYTELSEANVDIESLTVYGFNEFFDSKSVDSKDIADGYHYANDDQKYQLALDLFRNEDYYNAYLLLNELNGYDTSGTYLTECERLLQTVEINNPRVAEAIAAAMMDYGLAIHDYLYVYQVEKIESLDLSECMIEDLTFLEKFPNLKELNLNQNGLSNLMPLKDLYALERLSLVQNNISDVLPLYNLTNLAYLDLSENLIEDVTALGNLTLLKELDLSINNISTLSGLHTLENLEKVDLSYNFIYAVNTLSSSSIKELNILNTNISCLSEVANYSNLESLTAGFKLAQKFSVDHPFEQAILSKYKQGDGSVWEENLSGLEYIQGFDNLRYLELARLEAGEDEDNLLPLTTLSSLEVLKLFKYNGPNGVETLGKLTNLTELAVDPWMRGFNDLSFLPKLTKLTKFDGPAVPTLPLVAQLNNLEELRINGHIEGNLDFLGELKNLKVLTINAEPVVDILDFSPLGELENLEYLDIKMQNPGWLRNKPGFTQHNIEKVFELETLEYLNISMWQKHLESIEGIHNLKNLKYLGLEFKTSSDSRIVDEAQFMNAKNIILTEVQINEGSNKCQYRLGYLENKYDLQNPGESDLVYPKHLNFDINNNNQKNYYLQEYYVNSQNLSVTFWVDSPEFYDEIFTLKVPKGVRNLYIFNPSHDRIRLNIDATECIGLEWLVIGEVPIEGDSFHPHYGNKFIIDNLDGLSSCTNLREIYINEAEIFDISGLAGCDKLQTVQLNGNNISDISALADKIYLRELDLRNNDIENINTLESCISLQMVRLEGNPVKDIHLLTTLPLLD
jgi:Leucine-rich repeat (LRR) protein